jgi:hypothetical protein
MRPFAHSDGHDGPRLIDEFVPGVAAMVEQVFVGGEDPVGEPVVAQELPDVLDGVQLWALRRQWQDGDVFGHDEITREMPAGLIEQEHSMLAGRDLGSDLGEMQAHRLGVAVRQHECCALALTGTNGAEDIGRRGALIVRRAGAAAAPGPAAGDLVLLTDPGFVSEPDFYVGTCDVLCRGDFLQAGGKVFLNASTAPSACA